MKSPYIGKIYRLAPSYISRNEAHNEVKQKQKGSHSYSFQSRTLIWKRSRLLRILREKFL